MDNLQDIKAKYLKTGNIVISDYISIPCNSGIDIAMNYLMEWQKHHSGMTINIANHRIEIEFPDIYVRYYLCWYNRDEFDNPSSKISDIIMWYPDVISLNK